MRNLRKIVAMALACAMIVSLAACAGGAPAASSGEAPAASEPASSAAPAGDQKLSVWHLWTTDSDANAKSFKTVFEKWQSENPNVEVEIDATENEAYKTKLKTAIAANEAPDVFFSWGGGFAKPFAEAGALLPLDEYLAKGGAKDRMLPGTTDNMTYGGKVYGLPFIMWVGTLFCNKEMFEANSLELPATNEQLLAAVAGFKAKGIVPMTVGAKDGWPAMFNQNVYALRTAGADVCNATLGGEGSFDTPEMVQSAKLLDDLVKAGAFDPGALALTQDEAKMPFLNGEIPMLFLGSWMAGEIQDPNLSKVKDKVVAMNWPSVTGAKGDPNEILGGAIDCFMVSANAADKDLAANFAIYITENMSKESFKLGAGIATWKFDMSDVTVDPLVAQIIEIANKSTGAVLAWDTALEGEAAEQHKSLVQQIFAGQLTPENFAAEMQKLNP